MDIESTVSRLLWSETQRWSSVRNKWKQLTLGPSRQCDEHDLWEGAMWLYDLFEMPLRELRIIHNPCEFSESFREFSEYPDHDYGLTYLLGQQASFSIFWPIAHLRFKESILWNLHNLLRHFTCIRRPEDISLAPAVLQGIMHGLSADRALFHDFSSDCLLKQCDQAALVDFLMDCGVFDSDAVRRYLRFLGSGCFLSQLSTEYAVICKRPNYIRTDGEKLHCADGPAIEWSDGSKWYYLNGIKVPAEVVTLPASEVDPMLVLGAANAEVRREIVRKLGVETVIRKLGGRVLDNWQGYKLIALSIPGMEIMPVYLEMINPSTGAAHIEGVPPEIATCREALRWRVGGVEWNPEQLT